MAICKAKGCSNTTTYNNKLKKYNAVCQSCYRKSHPTTKTSTLKNAQKFVNKTVKKPVKKHTPKPKINPTEYYSVLKDLIDKRYRLESDTRDNWKEIKRGNSNLGVQQNRAFNKIGDTNHQINLIISELIKYGFDQRPAMKLAYDFSCKEETRLYDLIEAWERKIEKVDYGDSHWVDEHGNISYDSTSSYAYLEKQNKKLYKVQKNIEFIERYI